MKNDNLNHSSDSLHDMSDILGLLKTKLFLIGTISMIIGGAVIGIMGIDEISIGAFGFVLIFSGVILFISGFITPVVSESKTGMALAVFMILGAILAVGGVFALFILDEIGVPLFFGGLALAFLACLAWPCVCCQGSRDVRAQIIGIASAHDKITIAELSSISGATEKLTSQILFDAIGKRQLSGQMEGDTFVRSAPTTTTYAAPTTTTREREIVKVLVICPYCGAKTEQGIGKCQNCKADL